jgi:hypothetical protein
MFIAATVNEGVELSRSEMVYTLVRYVYLVSLLRSLRLPRADGL